MELNNDLEEIRQNLLTLCKKHEAISKTTRADGSIEIRTRQIEPDPQAIKLYLKFFGNLSENPKELEVKNKRYELDKQKAIEILGLENVK